MRARVNLYRYRQKSKRASRRPTTNATALAARRHRRLDASTFFNSTFLRSSWAIRISSSSSSKSTRSTWRTRSPPNISTNRTKRLWRILRRVDAKPGAASPRDDGKRVRPAVSVRHYNLHGQPVPNGGNTVLTGPPAPGGGGKPDRRETTRL